MVHAAEYIGKDLFFPVGDKDEAHPIVKEMPVWPVLWTD